MQRAISVGANQRAAVVTQVGLVQVTLGCIPLIVAIQRRHSQRQPANRAQRRQDRCQITPITGADDGNRRGVERRMGQQPVISRQQVAQVVFTRHPCQWNAGAPGVPAQVERQAHTSQTGDTFRPFQVALLAAAPPMHEQHARDF
ncbi:hypothetical protein D3C86_1793980 [compost metagenome]